MMLVLQRETGARAQAELHAVQQELEQEQAGNAARVEGLRSALQAQEARSSALDQELRSRPTVHQVSLTPLRVYSHKAKVAVPLACRTASSI